MTRFIQAAIEWRMASPRNKHIKVIHLLLAILVFQLTPWQGEACCMPYSGMSNPTNFCLSWHKPVFAIATMTQHWKVEDWIQEVDHLERLYHLQPKPEAV